MDMTLTRLLQDMQRAGAPVREQEVALAAFERLRTARAIAAALLADPSNADVLAVFSVVNALSADPSFRGLTPLPASSTAAERVA